MYPQMRHYVMEKYADLIGWIQYSLLRVLYDISDIIFELSSLENHIVPICIHYLRRICELCILKVESLGEMHYSYQKAC